MSTGPRYELGRVSQRALPHGRGCEDDSAAVDNGVLVVSGGEAAPVLDQGEGSFDNVAAAVGDGVVADGPSAGGAASDAVAFLVVGFGDHAGDAALPQVGADRAGGVRLVAEHPIRTGPGSSWPDARNVDRGEHGQAHRSVAGLARGEQDGQRPATAVDRGVSLRTRAATGTTQAMIVRFVLAAAQILVIRP